MKIRFGYVAMSTILEDCSPSKTITIASLNKIPSQAARIDKLTSLAKTNIANTLRLFRHNQAHGIKVFRITSKLVPLASHPITEYWDWVEAIGEELELLGTYARENDFRISAHPGHYTLLNSPKEEVFEASIKDLDYHCKLFDRMGLNSSAKLVMHVGGSYADKEKSMHRFARKYNQLPMYLKSRIVLENDDKIYTAGDVLGICEHLGIPMVLDIHHHWCNNESDNVQDNLYAIFATWAKESFPPKIHLSSPKGDKNYRSHADNIEIAPFLEFLEFAKTLNQDFDVMIEAKSKDSALFKLMSELKKISGIKIKGEASIEY